MPCPRGPFVELKEMLEGKLISKNRYRKACRIKNKREDKEWQRMLKEQAAEKSLRAREQEALLHLAEGTAPMTIIH